MGSRTRTRWGRGAPLLEELLQQETPAQGESGQFGTLVLAHGLITLIGYLLTTSKYPWQVGPQHKDTARESASARRLRASSRQGSGVLFFWGGPASCLHNGSKHPRLTCSISRR